jgi:hypothetical protein
MKKTYLDYENDLSKKLLIDLKENRISINEYREISRGMTVVFNYLYYEVELKEHR